MHTHSLILNSKRGEYVGRESMKGTGLSGRERGFLGGGVEVSGSEERREINDTVLQNGSQIQRMSQRAGKNGEKLGRREKKLVVSLLSVTSFVDSQPVSMTTVKSLQSVTRYRGFTCSDLFIDLI